MNNPYSSIFFKMSHRIRCVPTFAFPKHCVLRTFVPTGNITVIFNVFIIDHFDELIPFLVEEFYGAMLKMIMVRSKIPITWGPEIRMDKLHDKKVMDPQGFVVSINVMTVPRRSDAVVMDDGLLRHNFGK